MSDLIAGTVLITGSLLSIGLLVLGAELGGRMDSAYWRRCGYCPTCDRLTCEEEHA